MEIVVYFCLILHTVLCVYSPEKENEIRTETVGAATYDPISRPTAITPVTVGLSLLSVDELDLPAQKFVVAGWLTIEWEDDRLTWTPAAKDDIDTIFAKPATVWKPELIVDNSLDDLGVISDTNLLAKIKSDGTVEWEPPMLFTVHCEIDVTYYPYDQQKCGVEVASWGFSKSQVTLAHMNTGISLEDYRPNGEWEVVKTTTTTSEITETRNGVTESFSQLDFWMYLRRRDQFYNTNVMLPIILSSLLVTLVFVVPVGSGEKLSYILTVLLTIAVFLTIIGDTLPAISLTTSVLGIYVAATLCVAALATFLTVGILFIHHRQGEPRIGSIYYSMSRGIAKLCCWHDKSGRSLTKVEPAENGVPDKPGSGRAKSRSESYRDEPLTWVNIAEIWDWFCFVIFVIMTLLLNIVFILVLAVGGTNSSKA